jgi:hypothetical protein
MASDAYPAVRSAAGSDSNIKHWMICRLRSNGNRSTARRYAEDQLMAPASVSGILRLQPSPRFLRDIGRPGQPGAQA